MSVNGDIVVMKFGGTSVASAERIKHAAGRIVAQRERGNQVVAVLSARGSTTDELIGMAAEVSPRPHPRELDMLLSTGERISCALCAMAINDLGYRAISLTGSQAGIVTDTSHTKAKILDVRAELSFTVPRSDLRSARKTLEALTGELGLDSVIADEGMGTVSLIGAGMRSHPGVAAKVFQTLGDQEINIEMISTSPIKISCVIRSDRVPDAVRALHDAFGLGPERAPAEQEARA